ncbi:MAG TPA: hypothetical protein VKB78_04940 [Pirellulales bacterium]|nr:hypothetical protein [Pirellulales bacterium]
MPRVEGARSIATDTRAECPKRGKFFYFARPNLRIFGRRDGNYDHRTTADDNIDERFFQGRREAGVASAGSRFG